MAGGDENPGSEEKLPTGTLTFVLTDIEGSTVMWDEAPAAMAEAQQLHDALIASVVESYGGRLVKAKGEGDSTFSVFVDPTAAVLAAEKIRDAIRSAAWPTPAPIRARIGVSTGVAELRDGDYFGTTVVRAARVRSLARGDEVLLAASTYSLIADSLLRERVIEDRGEQELRGLQRPERVYALHQGEPLTPRPRRRRAGVLMGVGAGAVVVAVVAWLLLGRDTNDDAKVRTVAPTTVTTPKPSIDIASIELTNTQYYVRYDVTGTASRVDIPPYQIRVLARDPGTTDTWLWSYPAKIDASGHWTGRLDVAIDPQRATHLKVSAVVILPPTGDTSPTGPSQLPLTDPPTALERQLKTRGTAASGVIAVSDAPSSSASG